MEYRVNKYIDIQPLYDDRVLVLNKKNGQSYELGKKESIVISLIDGKKTPYEISELCGFFSEDEVISLENQLFELDIVGKNKHSSKLNLLKIKIPIFTPNKIFKDGIITNIFYYVFTAINGLFVICGIISTLLNMFCGISDDKSKYIQSFGSFQNFEYGDIAYVIIFFVISLMLHEFGHLIVARKHKINVPDVGFMFYLFVPCAYTNLTFLNYCNDKTIKLKVFLAGTLSDCGLLGIAMMLFHLCVPNPISKYFLISALVCMVSIIGNLVVTFKFDGYYILQTVLGVNNLKKVTINVIVTYIGTLLAKFKNRGKKLDLRQCGEMDSNLEFLFSFIYIFLSVIYVPIMIASGVIMTIIQLGGGLL